MRAAMQQQGLNPPKLAVKILAILRRTGERKLRWIAQPSIEYVEGKTKRPQPEIGNALIEALQLNEEDATIVHRELCGRLATRGSRKSIKPRQIKFLNCICNDLHRLQLVASTLLIVILDQNTPLCLPR